MRSYILFLALAALSFSSCSTAYKTGQTPDDVYYSPVRPQDEYVVAQQDDRYDGGNSDYYTDRYLRMRLNNRYQWSALDDYYFTNAYAYNSYSGYNNWYSPWNSYWAWNSYCNPYYSSPIFIKNPIRYRDVPSRAVVFNPKSYLNTAPQVNTTNLKGGSGSYYNPRYNNGGGSTRYNNSNNSSRSNNYSNSNNNNSRSNTQSNSTPTRSYNPPSSSSSSSSGGRSSSSSSSTPPSRPPR